MDFYKNTYLRLVKQYEIVPEKQESLRSSGWKGIYKKV